MESELFGTTEGAFTDAVDRSGMFQQASGGILFLNEIAEISHEAQAKLLQVLEIDGVRRIGAQQEEVVDAWVIAATNRNLEQAVEEGSFREDLYYRLAERVVWIPSLRERHQDIPLLVRHFAQSAAEELSRPLPFLSPDLLWALQSRPWRGNVRELKSTLYQLVGDAPCSVLTSALLRARGPGPASWDGEDKDETWHDVVHQLKRDYLRWAIQRWGPSRTRVAENLGVNRTYIYKLCRQLDVPFEP